MKLKYIALQLFVFFSFITFSQEEFYTCINEKGERMFSIKAKSVGAFSEGMAEVKQNVLDGSKSHYRSGFINEKGQVVIPCIYESVYAFTYGACWVKEPGQSDYYLINKKGERLTTETWATVGYFFDGHCAVYDEEGKMGFVNRKGELVIPCKYTGDSFSEGLACVMDFYGTDANYGFIDTTGKVVIPFQFNQAGTSSFENGECRVQKNGVTCLIDKTGAVVFKPTLTKNCMGFYEGLSASYTNSTDRSGWGFYNRENVWVIKPQFDNAESFAGGFAIVQKAGKYGVIDQTGKVVIPIQYASVYGSVAEDGFFIVEMEEGGDKKYLKADGTAFSTVSLKYIITSRGGKFLPYVSNDGYYGYLNMDGTIFLEAKYKHVSAFSEGKGWITGNINSLPVASGFSETNFAKEFSVGDAATCQKNKTGAYLPVTIDQVTEYYYLAKFEDGTQVWVVYNQLKR